YFKNKLLEASTDNSIAKNLDGTYFKIDSNNDGEIQESEALQVSELNVLSSSIAYFDGIAYFQNLIKLECTNNGRTGTGMGPDKTMSLDISGMPNLKTLNCNTNRLYLGIESFSNLENLYMFHCRGFSETGLDFTGFNNLKELSCGRTYIETLNIDGLTGLEYLDISFNHITSYDLTSFVNLKYINSSHSTLGAIDASNMIYLEELYCNWSSLASLNVTGCTGLKRIFCNSTPLTTLDAGNLPQLEELRVEMSQISTLNVQGSTNLIILMCGNSNLTSLDLSNLPNLASVTCRENQLQTLSLTGSPYIFYLDCGSNYLQTLDCSDQSNLVSLTCIYNQLTSLNINNGFVETDLSFNGNPNLQYICVDEEQVAFLQAAYPSYTFDSTCALNTNNLSTRSGIAIYPNPSASVVNIASDNEISKITILTLLGQQVISKANFGKSPSIDISTLAKGTYCVVIETPEGKVNKRLMKN
ncbi:MAG TPA: T9SS type A sorting domain-containing protein, partial [Flavobacterium sp.]